MSFWTDEYDGYLRSSVESAATFAVTVKKLNAKFGTTFTRNAAIGRAKRIGLCSPNPAKMKSKVELVNGKKPWEAVGVSRRTWNRHKQIAEGTYVRPEYKPRPRKVEFQRDAAGMRVADVMPLHLSLIDLETNQCRWPFGDGPFTFCGCQTFDGSSYCEPHLSLSERETHQGSNWHQTERQRAAHRKVILSKQAVFGSVDDAA